MNTVTEGYPQEKYAQALYDGILTVANEFLHNCKHFSVDILREERPTYAEIAEMMDKVSKVILALADDYDPWICQKAFEYCLLMKNIGKAIHEGDEGELAKHVEQLNRKPFI